MTGVQTCALPISKYHCGSSFCTILAKRSANINLNEKESFYWKNLSNQVFSRKTFLEALEIFRTILNEEIAFDILIHVFKQRELGYFPKEALYLCEWLRGRQFDSNKKEEINAIFQKLQQYYNGAIKGVQ